MLIIGSDGTPYGQSPPQGRTWKRIFFDEVASRVDHRRIHFLGQLPYRDYLCALQISSAHVYLTYPFVLSWSLLEAMSAGCAIIASDTAPVQEVINGDNGLLVPFFSTHALTRRVIEVLSNPGQFEAMRTRARAFVIVNYDARRKCIPRFLAMLDRNGSQPSHENSANEESRRA